MKTELKNEMFKIGVLAALVVVAMPELSVAQEAFSTLSETFAKEEVGAVPYIVSVVGYVIGTVLMLSGALSLKKHSENPASEPLNKGLGRLLVGAGITALPSILNIMQTTTGFSGQGSASFEDFAPGF